MPTLYYTSERAGVVVAWAVIDNGDLPVVSIGDGGSVVWTYIDTIAGTTNSLAFAWAEYPAETANAFDPLWYKAGAMPGDPPVEIVPVRASVYCIDGCVIEQPTTVDSATGTDSLSLSGSASDPRAMVVGLLGNVLTADTEMVISIGLANDREAKLGTHYPIEGAAQEYLAFQKGGNAGWTWNWSTGEEGIGVSLRFNPLDSLP